MLWDYLSLVINNWNGDAILMGDFNEVRTIEERHGSLFDILAADVFNSFIYRNGLKEIPLGGCKFTWCHKSAVKMSKLDGFLISEGFDNFIESTWNEANVYNSNAMSKLIIKLKFLKEKIRTWVKVHKDSIKKHKQGLKEKLVNIDTLIDIGEGNKDLINKRTELSNSLQELNKLESLELAQKTKIKWAIEGDENSNFEQQTDLEINITRDEIKKAVWDCGVDKSPGPDGFSFGFFVDIGLFWKTM
ncbi:RNA-directed DNA polymerase, eukaryota [Tanacetum coccineum]